MYADALIQPWFDAIAGALPGLAVYDAHTHTGQNDPDGFRCTGEELSAALALANARGVVFSSMDPGGYREPNDRTLREARESNGRLVSFCRLDPHDSPIAEAERSLEAGHVGIKLHPRAEQFGLDHPAVEAIFALAHERRLPVLVHAGRGIPALGERSVDLCSRYPDARMILAHAGISDLSWLWRPARELPNMLFDTSWWSASDLLTLFSLVPPGRVLWASDAPYGTPTAGIALGLRCAFHAGLSAEAIAGVAGGQLERVLAREPLLDLGPAPETPLRRDLLLERVGFFVTAAFGRLVIGDPGTDYLGLARLACDVPPDVPQAPVCRSVVALLDRQARYVEGGGTYQGGRTPGMHLIMLAAAVALAPDAPLPADSAVRDDDV